MGVGRNASSSGGPIRGYFAQGTQRLARRRIGQASSCRRGNHRPYRRVETRPLLYSQQKTTQRRKATCTETDKLSCPDFFPVALQWFPGGSCTRWSQAPFTAHCYGNYGSSCSLCAFLSDRKSV